MIATYIFIICLSAVLASWAGLRLWQRVMLLLGNRQTHSGSCAIIPALAFLMVVGAPGSMLFFALASVAFSIVAPRMFNAVEWRTGWVALAVGVALAFMPTPTTVGGLPLSAIYGGSFALWLAIAFSSAVAPNSLSRFAGVVIASCVPLAATPFLLHHTSSVATDAAILSSAWFGILLIARFNQLTGSGAQLATALVLGGLQITAISQGAWIAGIVSILVWGAMITMSGLQQSHVDEERLNKVFPHA